MFKNLFSRWFGGASQAPQHEAVSWREGGLYVVPAENGGYSPLKILKCDEHGVHVRTYSNVYPALPQRIDEAALYMAGMNKKDDEPMGMGHLPVSYASFAGWGVVFVQESSVAADELEGYAYWQDAKGGYF